MGELLPAGARGSSPQCPGAQGSGSLRLAAAQPADGGERWKYMVLTGRTQMGRAQLPSLHCTRPHRPLLGTLLCICGKAKGSCSSTCTPFSGKGCAENRGCVSQNMVDPKGTCCLGTLRRSSSWHGLRKAALCSLLVY